MSGPRCHSKVAAMTCVNTSVSLFDGTFQHSDAGQPGYFPPSCCPGGHRPQGGLHEPWEGCWARRPSSPPKAEFLRGLVAAQPSAASCGCRMGQHKRGGPQERLLTRFPSAQGVEGDEAGIQVHLTSHQAMGPERIHGERVSQQLDHVPPQGARKVLPPPCGKRPPGWGRFDAGPGSPVVGGEIARRPALEIGEGVVMEPLPDLHLPLGIEPFDGGLKARLPRGREDGHDCEGQTQADHTAHRIGMLMGALKPGIVIELGKHWQSPGTPMLY
jgi:hypothetical protein